MAQEDQINVILNICREILQDIDEANLCNIGDVLERTNTKIQHIKDICYGFFESA